MEKYLFKFIFNICLQFVDLMGGLDRFGKAVSFCLF